MLRGFCYLGGCSRIFILESELRKTAVRYGYLNRFNPLEPNELSRDKGYTAEWWLSLEHWDLAAEYFSF